MKINLSLFSGAILFLATALSVNGGTYYDNHDDGSLSGWTSKGKRGWSESGESATPNGQTNCKGYLINDFPCADNGTFTFTMKGNGDLNSLDGGGVFRFTDINHFYFVSVYEANSNDRSPDNAVRLRKNSTDARSDYITIQDTLNFYGFNNVYTIKIHVQGPTFTFWLNDDSLGQYTDTANPCGSVGYAYDDLYDPYVSFDASSWIDAVSHYTWDTSETVGIQAGNGVWGTGNYWTSSNDGGTSLTAWPGAGNSATFAGTDGSYIITVNHIQAIDSMAFLNDTYTLNDGTIDLGTNNGIYVAAGKKAVIGSVIDGSAGLSKYGNGALTLTGTNTFTGTTVIDAGTLQMGDGGVTGVITGPIANNGILIYNRTTDDSVTDAISGSGTLSKNGTATLSLNGANTYTGATTVTAGTLLINGSIAAASAVTVSPDATFGGTGICNGPVSVHGGIIAPGNSIPGKLSTGDLTLDTASILNFDLGTKSDTLAVTGTLALGGRINFSAAAGCTVGTYRLITYSGTLTDNSLMIGTWPEGMNCTLVSGSNYFDVVVSRRLIQAEPRDTVTLAGRSVSFTVIAKGKGTLFYKWLRYSTSAVDNPTDSIGDAATLSLASVAPADNGARFCCIVRDDIGTDSSRRAVLTVIDTPRIIMQPQNIGIAAGEIAFFSLSVKDTVRVTYSWRKTGSETELGTANSLAIADVAYSDTGNYYCIVGNPVARLSSDTVRLDIRPPKPAASFIFTPKSGPAPLQVAFADVSTGTVVSRQWKFGDGGYDTVPQPLHRYTKPGCYSVTLIVTYPNGADTLEKIDSITVYEKDQVNSIVIDTLFFDTVSGSIRISWCIDSAALVNDPVVGITCGPGRYPIDTTGISTVAVSSHCTDTIVRLNEPFCTGTTYYIALWFRLRNGIWIEPTVDSRTRIHLGSPFREIITFFDPCRTDDTVTAFDDRVILWNDICHTSMKRTTDTLEMAVFDTLPAGLIPVGMPFTFKNGDANFPLFIGIHIDSLPAGASPNDVHIYNYSAGLFNVNYATAIDTVQGIAYVKTDQLHGAFIAMLDTLNPSVFVCGDMTSPVISTVKLNYAINIVDNIANVRWKYLYGKGNEIPVLRASGDMSTAGKLLSLVISDTTQAISSESGLRALLITDDACHIDTLNLSRCVYRFKSDTFTSDANRWVPVYSTAVLDDKDAGPLIGQLLQHYDVGSYDQSCMRLYRWCNYQENGKEPVKWVEYDPVRKDVQSLFTLEPGRLVWLKTSDNVPLHLNSGYTLPLKDTLTVDLPSKQWTDFGMPYRFGVRMEEIISATGKDADYVQLYRWKRDSSTNMYTLDPLYVPGFPDKNDRSEIIDYIHRGGYSFYNDHSKTVTLRIPPVPCTMANVLKKTVSANTSSWSTKFVARADDSTRLSSVYFGYSPHIDNGLYPLAPSFSSLGLSVFDRTTSKRYGHYISQQVKEGLIKELLISNSGDSARSICYHLEQVGSFPKNYTANCYNAAGESFDTCGTITVAPRSTASRWIIVGDAAFHQNFISRISTQCFSLYPPYPNPSHSVVHIRYTVPFGSQEHIAVAIYNVLGKRVWQKRLTGFLSEGFNQVTWNGMDERGTPAGSGLYVIQVIVENASGKVIRRFEKRATLLR